MIKETRLAFIDLETSGLDPELHEILEIGVIVTDFKLKELGSLNCKVIPVYIEGAEEKALKTCGYDKELWEKEAIPLKEALKKLNKLVPFKEKAIPVGHNIKRFDIPFMRKAYKEEGIFDILSWTMIDTWDLAATYKVISGEQLPNFKLGTLASHFGIEIKTAHRAMDDIRANLEIFKELAGLMKIGFESCLEDEEQLSACG